MQRIYKAHRSALGCIPTMHWHANSKFSWLLTELEVRLKKAIFVSVILQGTSFSLCREPTASTVLRAEHVQQLALGSCLRTPTTTSSINDEQRVRSKKARTMAVSCLFCSSARHASAFLTCSLATCYCWCAHSFSCSARQAVKYLSGLCHDAIVRHVR